MRLLRPLAFVFVPALLSTAGCNNDSGGEIATAGTTETVSTGSETGTTTGASSSTGPSSETTSAAGTTSTGSDPATTGDATTTTGADDGSSTGALAQTPPIGEADLLPWLEAGNYARWAAEAEQHPSAGPHFAAVRTFVNEPLLESLEGGSEDHPVGSAVVKELYGDTPEVGGWAVMVKTAPGSSVDSWYWFEWFTGTTYADENGNNGCGNCHGLGLDFVRTQLPL